MKSVFKQINESIQSKPKTFGQIFQYIILRAIKKGPNSKVYLVVDKEINQHFALKCFPIKSDNKHIQIIFLLL
jgi:hypothetical protein